MSIQNLLYEYNPWWSESMDLSGVIKRSKLLDRLYLTLDTPDVLMLTGLRRVGKTITMKCLIDYLISVKRVEPRHCLYISMDDYALNGMSLSDVLDVYRECQKLPYNQKVFVFFDEITYIKDFQIQLKNLYDKGLVKCVVSSSSSSVLRDDTAVLTGRKKVVAVEPLDFEEFLHFKNLAYSVRDKALMDSYLQDYMQVGGMPEYVLRQDREYLTGLIDDILMRDIVAYHGVRQPERVRDCFILLMERAGKQVSINKLAHILSITPDSVKRYLTMFEEAYLIQLVSRHGKTNETLLSSKKVYATDLGMRNVITGFRDKGAVFENLVYMAIKSYKPRYVNVNSQELDFIVNDVLVEVKFHRDIEGKQKQAFEDYQAKEKLVVRNYLDLKKLYQMLA